MKQRVYYLLFIFLLIVFLILGGFLLNQIFDIPVQAAEYEVTFSVGEGLGFDLNASALTFGKIPQGGNIIRNINIENNYDFPVEVRILASKNIIDLIVVPENISISPGEEISVPVNLIIPENFTFGEYSGKMKFELYKA